MHPSLAALRALLLSPREFFGDPDPSFGNAVLVVLAVATVSTVGFLAMGWLFARSVDATVTVTTMEPWGEMTCESFAEMNTSTTPPNCAIDEPRTRQVDVGSKLWDAFVGRVPLVFVGTLLGWLLVAVALHATTAFLGRTGGFRRTLTVAGYGMVPSMLQTVAAVLAIWLAVRGETFTGDPQALADQFRALTSGIRPVATAGLLVATAWQAYVWAGGLDALHDCDREAAYLAAGVVGLISLLLSAA